MDFDPQSVVLQVFPPPVVHLLLPAGPTYAGSLLPAAKRAASLFLHPTPQPVTHRHLTAYRNTHESGQLPDLSAARADLSVMTRGRTLQRFVLICLPFVYGSMWVICLGGG